MKIGTLTVEIEADSKRLDRGLDRSERSINTFTQRAGVAVKRLGAMTAAATAAGAVLGGVLAVKAKNVTLEFQAIDRTLKAATGSMESGAQAFAFVSSEADRLGLNLRKSAGEFARLAAAAKGTALEGQDAQEIFSAIATASTALGLTAEQTSGALNAVQQMISKGTVAAEELRGQLGERLPGAFQIAAKAMGVTTQELGKMLENGEVMAEDLLPKLATALQTRFAGAAEEAANGAQGAFNRLENSVDQLMLTIGESGLIDAMADTAEWIAKEFIPGITYLAERIGLVETNFRSLTAAQAMVRLDDAKQEIEELTESLETLEAQSGGGQMARGRAAAIERIREELAAAEAQAASAQERIDAVLNPPEVVGGGDGDEGPAPLSKKEQEKLNKKRKAVADEVEMIRDQFKTEEELLRDKVTRDAEILIEALDNELITKQERWELERDLKRMHEDELTEIEEKASEARRRVAELEAKAKKQAFDQMFTDLTSLMNTESRKMFEIGKAAAISQTVMNTYEGAQKAFNAMAGIPIVGPALGAAAAAAAIASGVARVQAIRSTSFGSSSASNTAGGTSAPAAAATSAQGGGEQPARRVFVEGINPDTLINGRQLIEILNNAQEDGPALITAGARG